MPKTVSKRWIINNFPNNFLPALAEAQSMSAEKTENRPKNIFSENLGSETGEEEPFDSPMEDEAREPRKRCPKISITGRGESADLERHCAEYGQLPELSTFYQEVQEFVAEKLAEFCTPRSIQRALEWKLQVTLAYKDIEFIKQQLALPMNEIDPELQGLKLHFDSHRVKFQNELRNIPIANKRIRLQELQALYDEASGSEPKAILIPDVDQKTKKQRMDGNGRPIFRPTIVRGKKDLVAAAQILKQASQEVGDWTDRSEVKGGGSWAERVRAKREERGL